MPHAREGCVEVSRLQAMTRSPRWMRSVRIDVTDFLRALDTLTRDDMRNKKPDDVSATRLVELSREIAHSMVKLPAVRRIMGRTRDASDDEMLDAAAALRDCMLTDGEKYAENMREMNSGLVGGAEQEVDRALQKMIQTDDFKDANAAIEARRKRT